jgi:beta-hydroxyacyl-ACP dehydratase FabZ
MDVMPTGAASQDRPADGETIGTIDIAGIMQAIPHRYPFLLIDRVVDVVLNRSAVGVKNVSINESFFQGHFPAHPVMPGVLIIESMAQTAAVLVVTTLGEAAAGKIVYFMSIEAAKFRPVADSRHQGAQPRQRLEVRRRGARRRRFGGRGDLCRDDHGPRRRVIARAPCSCHFPLPNKQLSVACRNVRQQCLNCPARPARRSLPPRHAAS